MNGSCIPQLPVPGMGQTIQKVVESKSRSVSCSKMLRSINIWAITWRCNTSASFTSAPKTRLSTSLPTSDRGTNGNSFRVHNKKLRYAKSFVGKPPYLADLFLNSSKTTGNSKFLRGIFVGQLLSKTRSLVTTCQIVIDYFMIA